MFLGIKLAQLPAFKLASCLHLRTFANFAKKVLNKPEKIKNKH